MAGTQAQVLWHRANLVRFLWGNQESPVIMINSCPLIFALALLVNLFVHSATSALPASRIKDDPANRDSLSSVMDEDAMNVAGPGDFSPRRVPLIEGRLADEDGTKRIFILSVSIVAEDIAQYMKNWLPQGVWDG